MFTAYLSCWPHGFREFSIFLIRVYGSKSPKDLANLDLRGMVGKIYAGDHQTLIYTLYISCGPHGFRGFLFPFIVNGR